MLCVRIVFVEPITSAAMQCSCRPLTAMCYHHQRPREANIFQLLPLASGRGSTVNFYGKIFFVKTFFEAKLMETNCHQYRLTSFIKISTSKRSVRQFSSSVDPQFSRSVDRQFSRSVDHQFGSSLVRQISSSVDQQFGRSVDRQFGRSIVRQIGSSQIGSSVDRQFSRSVIQQISSSVVQQFSRSVVQQISSSWCRKQTLTC